MTKRTMLALATLLATAGCGPRYYKPGATAADFERDKYDCEHNAAAYASSWGTPGNPFLMADDMKQCLTKKYGWSTKPAG
jgi:predicted small lipoprotein YifL